MTKNLPFVALRTFESVARLRGFALAAEELGVTQGAVSQHVKALENWLGVKLLNRDGGRVTSTDAGARLAVAIARGFGNVSDVCDDLKHRNDGDMTITLSCLPGFAFIWLFPRLITFDELYPNYPVSIKTSASLSNFTDDGVDIAIRYGPGGYRGYHVEKLMSELIFPVCSPSLLKTGAKLDRVEDLAHHTLLVDEVEDLGSTPPTWDYWALETSNYLPKPARLRKFGQSNMVVQAAIKGMGIALGRESLVIDALADNRLVRPFKGTALSQFSYWIVCPAASLKIPRIAAFRDWLINEAQRQSRLTQQLVTQ
jgi:LysR family transcriptional regulator, glycine cleavage system transcriptional activator